ncbi:MAG: hypothetical protein IJQ73_13480 [Kiritimatiellae bacterium]|nr:hypothetical protein [Kiritimatiellia bacterium]
MENKIDALELHSEGRKDGEPFSLASVPASVLKSVIDIIPVFVAGSRASSRTKSIVESSITYSFENGSLRIKTSLAAVMATVLQESDFISDFAAIAQGKMEEVSDVGRIESIRDLKRDLISGGATTVELSSAVAKVPAFDIANRNVETPTSLDPWVDSESYVMATVIDIGGKNKANAHLELDNGELVVADSARNYLASLENNLLYKKVLAHVAYRVNLRTKDWQNIRLVSLSLPKTTFDAVAFDKAVSRPSAWDEVADPVAEIRRMRGDNG